MKKTEKVTPSTQEAGSGKRRRPPREEDDVLLPAPGADPGNRLKAERVQEMLRAMPEWKRTLEGKGIDRVKKFPTAEIASLYGAYVTGFGRVQKVPIGLYICGATVTLTLHERRDRGRHVELTERVVKIARQLG